MMILSQEKSMQKVNNDHPLELIVRSKLGPRSMAQINSSVTIGLNVETIIDN